MERQVIVSLQDNDNKDIASLDLLWQQKNVSIGERFNQLVMIAQQSRASDIHLEPHPAYIYVRFRVDGVLHEAGKIPKYIQPILTNYVKILSHMELDSNQPQTGQGQLLNSDINFYATTVPTITGERIIVKLKQPSVRNLSELGLWGSNLLKVEDGISSMRGLVVLSGPLASGRSATLSSIIKFIDPHYKVAVIQDSTELPRAFSLLQNISIFRRNSLTIADTIKLALSQNPDCLVLPRLSDQNTAQLALQAAASGKLVITFLPINDALSVFSYLIKMGLPVHQVAHNLTLSIHQRLVRQLNSVYKIERRPTVAERHGIEKYFSLNETKYNQLYELEKQAIKSGMGDDTLSTSSKKIEKIYEPNPEIMQEYKKYSGRIGLFEVAEPNPEIINSLNASKTSTKQLIKAAGQNYIDVKLDGLVKALRGQTTLDEVMRVTSK